MRLRFAFLAFAPAVALAQGQPPPERSPFTGGAVPAPPPAAATAPAPAVTPAPAAAPAVAPAPAPVAPTPVAPTPLAPAPNPPREEPRHRGGGPEANVGFQMHFVPMAAVSFPFGYATDARGDSLSARYGWQWMPLEVGLGAKLLEQLYLGGYLNVAVGSEGDDLHTQARCEAGSDVEDDVSCSATSVHLGLELRYTFTPAERLTGWVGYGAGITVGNQTISDAGRYSETATSQGFDWARISGGMDFRASRGFGMGPFATISIGSYIHQRTEISNIVTYSGEIEDAAMHAWLSVGLRMLVFP
jgi:hypothetical protein